MTRGRHEHLSRHKAKIDDGRVLIYREGARILDRFPEAEKKVWLIVKRALETTKLREAKKIQAELLKVEEDAPRLRAVRAIKF